MEAKKLMVSGIEKQIARLVGSNNDLITTGVIKVQIVQWMGHI